MKITLTPEQRRIIDKEIKSGHFSTPDEVLDEALAALCEKRQSRREAVRRLQEFGDKHRLSLGGIPIKEFIHEGHRL
jgi:Arc/MetJ-type ribon-helix-helix transcriptional regulator